MCLTKAFESYYFQAILHWRHSPFKAKSLCKIIRWPLQNNKLIKLTWAIHVRRHRNKFCLHPATCTHKLATWGLGSKCLVWFGLGDLTSLDSEHNCPLALCEANCEISVQAMYILALQNRVTYTNLWKYLIGITEDQFGTIVPYFIIYNVSMGKDIIWYFLFYLVPKVHK